MVHHHGVKPVGANGEEDRGALGVLLVRDDGATIERVRIECDEKGVIGLFDAFGGEFDAKRFGVAGDGDFSWVHGWRHGKTAEGEEEKYREKPGHGGSLGWGGGKGNSEGI